MTSNMTFETRKYDSRPAHTDDETGEVTPRKEWWAVYELTSGLRVEYSTDKAHAVNTAARWNAGKVPTILCEKIEAARSLKAILSPGDKVQTILRHVSRSGMMRHISPTFKGQDLTWSVSQLLGEKIAQDGGIKLGGCGMDMGFNLVYNMGRILWPDGTPKPHGSRNGEPNTDGGYALKQEWL